MFTVERSTKGRKRGKTCRPKRRRGRRCTIVKTLPGKFKLQGKQGTNTFKFSGRLASKKLRPGRYRLAAVPTDMVGNRGVAVRAAFKIVG